MCLVDVPCFFLCCAEMSRRQCKVFFGDLVCKWWPWLEYMASSDHEALAELPEELRLTLQQLHTMRPATSAVHSHAHVWYCQASASFLVCRICQGLCPAVLQPLLCFMRAAVTGESSRSAWFIEVGLWPLQFTVAQPPG
jgi:hypothetical protein